MAEDDAHARDDAGSHEERRRAHGEVQEQGKQMSENERAMAAFARRMDWLVFSWARKAPADEGGEGHVG